MKVANMRERERERVKKKKTTVSGGTNLIIDFLKKVI